jgi:hypothetical protein
VAWGATAIIGVDAAGAGLLAWAAAAMGAGWSRWRARRRIGRRIAEVYDLILAKAEAARAADYAQPPPEAFALYHALREQLFDFARAGGAIQALKAAVMRAATEGAASSLHVKGAPVGARPAPQSLDVDPRPGEALKAEVLAFCDYWSRRAKVEAELRGALRNLGADAPMGRRGQADG